jgi:HSP20 family protein
MPLASRYPATRAWGYIGPVTPDRDLLFDFERVRREMDELFDDVWGMGRVRRRPTGFSPRLDLYYCGAEEPKAVVKVELPGVPPESIDLEISGRDLVISGERPVAESEGRVYQQIEIEMGPFRRTVRLSADVDADRTRASYDDGILRIELPLRTRQEPRRVPISSEDDG